MSESLDNLSRMFGLKSSNKEPKKSLTPEDAQKEIEAKKTKKAEMEKRAVLESRKAAKQMYEQMLRDAETGKETPLPIGQIRQILDVMEKDEKEK